MKETLKLIAAFFAACFTIGAFSGILGAFSLIGIASAHSNQPANRCTIAVVTWQNNPTPGNAALATACINSHTAGFNTPGFNTANFGFNNGFGFNPAYGFNPGFGGFIPFDGFGQTVSECPPGTSALEGGTVQHPAWTCVPGLGNRFPGACPLGLNLFETGPVSSPVWDCVL